MIRSFFGPGRIPVTALLERLSELHLLNSGFGCHHDLCPIMWGRSEQADDFFDMAALQNGLADAC